MDASRGWAANARCHDSLMIDGWDVAAGPAGLGLDPAETADLDWFPMRVPGTVASAHVEAGRPLPADLDASEWWFRTPVELVRCGADDRLVLCIDGVATVAEVYVDGGLVASSVSMYERSEIDLTSFGGRTVELLVCCRPLHTSAAMKRRPRARWRTRLAHGDLRWHRTTLLGRAPGFAPTPPPVGPWRPIRLEHRNGVDVRELHVRPTLVDGVGHLQVDLVADWIGERRPMSLEVTGPSGSHRVRMVGGDDEAGWRATGHIVIPDVEMWYPHTHGRPVLHDIALRVGDDRRELGRVGFRNIGAGPTSEHDIEQEGLSLHVNGVGVFVRGFVWSSLDATSLQDEPTRLRRDLTLIRDAGANMIRVPGTGTYLGADFHDLCDELGILVWQDLMFANFDYPFDDDDFAAAARGEVSEQLGALAGRASLAVVCGGSEIQQQAAMVGVAIDEIGHRFFDQDVPSIIEELSCDCVYVPSSPFGGPLPFRNDRGVAHYFGVGGYRRPLADVRSAGVRFASECLAFANVPEAEGMSDILDDGTLVVTHPAWKAGVPRDIGAGWDFDDVRDHYLRERYGIDPVMLRSVDHGRYLVLSRRVTGEIMQEVFGEWRRPDSACAGGLILWWRDVVPGAGWGVIDSAGRPKAAYHFVKRIFEPVAVWTTDEGLGGVRVHVANDRAAPIELTLRVATFRCPSGPIDQATVPIEVGPRGVESFDLEVLIGRFIDASCAYRFGSPAHDLIAATLHDLEGRLVARHLRFPADPPVATQSLRTSGLALDVDHRSPESVSVTLHTESLALGLRVRMDGFVPSDDVFDIEPGGSQSIELRALGPSVGAGRVVVSADNLDGVLSIDLADRAADAR